MKRSRLSIRGNPSNQEFGRKCSEEGELLSSRHEKKLFVIRGIDKLLLEEASGKRTSRGLQKRSRKKEFRPLSHQGRRDCKESTNEDSNLYC